MYLLRHRVPTYGVILPYSVMSSKVEVLCPNGHRVNVKTNPNTKLLQASYLPRACYGNMFLVQVTFNVFKL